MRQITNISEDAYQTRIIPLEDNEITVDMKFLNVVGIWIMNITYKGEIVNGVKMSVGTPHVLEKSWPFDFYILDQSENGLDPFKLDDFTTNRCAFYILDPDDVEEIRGFPVEL